MSWLDAAIDVTGIGARKRAVLGDYLSAADAERAAESAIAWIKAVRLLRVDGVSLRDRFSYRHDSLWWFAELYLHKEDQVARWFAAIAAIERMVETESPRAVAIETADASLAWIGRRVAERAGIEWRGERLSPEALQDRLRLRVRSAFLTWSAYWSRQRGSTGPSVAPLARGAIAAFVHGAFWRGRAESGEGEEGYIGPVLREIERRSSLVLVGVGPRTNFRARRWWKGATEDAATPLPFVPVEQLAPRRSLGGSQSVWAERREHARAMRASSDLREHARVDGLDLWPLACEQLDGIAWLQFPWSARAMDEAGAAMDALEPSAVLTYAEAGGWGRAIMLEARRRRVPSAGLQHGFIYRHWLNYRHALDEMAPSPALPADAGFPRPDVTLLFDGYARGHLVTAGSFPEAALLVTGSPRLDDTVSGIRALTDADRARIRASIGASDTDRIVVVATKHSQIRRVFRDLVAAAGTMANVRLVVKCHPAETAASYEADAAGAAHVTIAPPEANLAGLIAVARGVVTVNSTVAIDAMVTGVPSLVVDLPNNLSPFVDAGVMLGAASRKEISAGLHALVDDEGARGGVAARQSAFLAEHRIGADGRAAERAAAAIAGLASPSKTGSDPVLGATGQNGV